MRSGFSVCAKAFRCQVLFPKKLPRSTTCSFRVATLLRLETLAEYSRTSPARRGNSVSAGGRTFFELAGKVCEPDFAAGAPTGFFAEGTHGNRVARPRRLPERAVAHARVSNKRPPRRKPMRPLLREQQSICDSCPLWDAPLNQPFARRASVVQYSSVRESHREL